MGDLAEAGGHAIKLDVMDHDGIAAAVQQIVTEQGRIERVTRLANTRNP